MASIPGRLEEPQRQKTSSSDSLDQESVHTLVASAAPAIDLEKAPSAPSAPNPADFPDGGLEAWLVVLGGFCTVFAGFGWINCIGVFQEYYQTNQLSSYSPSTVAWIPSTESFMMFFWGPVVGWMIDQFGPRLPIAIGSVLHIFGLMMTSISKEYYQIFLSQSVVSAIGCSFLFYPAVTACSTWFLKYRALAIGITVSGSSIGGVILPIMVERLISRIGFGWTIRAVAFLLLGFVIVGNLTIRSRIPPVKRPFVLKDFFMPYTEPAFLLLTIGSWLVYIGGFLPFTFIIVQARARGMSANLAGYLVSILNGASTFGRIIPSYYGDKYGVFNVMILHTLFGALVNVALWLPSTVLMGNTNALIICFIASYGFASGCFLSIIPAMIAKISPDVRKLGVRTGSLYIVSATGVLIGSPIGGVIAAGSGNGFLGLSLFSGLTLLTGALFVVGSRIKQTGLRLMVKA